MGSPFGGALHGSRDRHYAGVDYPSTGAAPPAIGVVPGVAALCVLCAIVRACIVWRRSEELRRARRRYAEDAEAAAQLGLDDGPLASRRAPFASSHLLLSSRAHAHGRDDDQEEEQLQQLRSVLRDLRIAAAAARRSHERRRHRHRRHRSAAAEGDLPDVLEVEQEEDRAAWALLDPESARLLRRALRWPRHHREALAGQPRVPLSSWAEAILYLLEVTT